MVIWIWLNCILCLLHRQRIHQNPNSIYPNVIWKMCHRVCLYCAVFCSKNAWNYKRINCNRWIMAASCPIWPIWNCSIWALTYFYVYRIICALHWKISGYFCLHCFAFGFTHLSNTFVNNVLSFCAHSRNYFYRIIISIVYLNPSKI